MLSHYPEQAVAIMSQAFDMAALSTARRRKTGAYIVRQLAGNYFQPVSSGYNGTRPGESNICETIQGISKGRTVVHAEQNCLIKMMTMGVATEGCTVVTTFLPCANCCELIIDAKIREVLYCETSDNPDKLDSIFKLQKAGVAVCGFSKHDVIDFKQKQVEALAADKFMAEDVEEEYQYFLRKVKRIKSKNINVVAQTVVKNFFIRSLTNTNPDWTNTEQIKKVVTPNSFIKWFTIAWESLRDVEDSRKKELDLCYANNSMSDIWGIYCEGKEKE